MTESDTKKLLEQINKFLSNPELSWESLRGKRTVSYIPFSPKEDWNKEVLKQVQGDRDCIMLRSFGLEIQKALDKKGDNFEIKPDNIISCFQDRLSVEEQSGVLEAVARKTPRIIQHGSDKPVPELRDEDVVNITGHGDRKFEFIHSIGNDPNHRTRRGVPDRTELHPGEVLERMNGDLGTGVQKIKLGSCGSGGAFSEQFLQEAEKRKLYLGAKIDAYELDSIMYLDKQMALEGLRLGGKRFVVSDDKLGDAPELTDRWRVANKELDTRQKSLATHLREERLSKWKSDGEGWGREKILREEKVTSQLEVVDILQQQLSSKLFKIAQRANTPEGRKTLSVGEKLGLSKVSGSGGLEQGVSVVHGKISH